MEFNLFTISRKGLLSSSLHINCDGTNVYQVNRESTFSLRNHSFNDANGTTIFSIYKKPSLLKYQFQIIQANQIIATLDCKTFSNEILVDTKDSDYTIKGNLWNSEYSIFNEVEAVAKISRKIFALKDKYGVAIHKGQPNDLLLAFVVVIEIINIAKNQKG